jgi:hypothetical protein
MAYLHKNLGQGRWQKLSLAEQLANIGAEVGRTAKWQGKDEALFQGAVLRALELFDLTLADQRWKGRLREIGRLREAFLDGTEGGKEYNTSLKALERYFMPFTVFARSRAGA